MPRQLDANTKIAVARAKCAQVMPYTQTAVRALIPVPTDRVSTMAVDDKARMLYNPSFVEGASMGLLVFALLHEAQHLIRLHCRATPVDEADAYLHNLAKDMSINSDLRRAGLFDKIDIGGFKPVFPESNGYDDSESHPWTYFYDLLKNEPEPPQPEDGDGVGQGQCGGVAGNPQPGEGEGEGGDGQDGDDQGGQGGGGQGDGQGGLPEGRSDAEMFAIAVSAAKEMAQAGLGRGSMPAEVQQHLDALTPPTLSWDEHLAVIVDDAAEYKRGSADYTYRYTSRRQSAVGYGAGRPVLPGMQSPVPHVVVAVDTSGSMLWDGRLEKAVAEVGGILEAAEADVTVMTGDAAVHETIQAATIEDVLAITGGGGTDFRPAFDAAAQLPTYPDLFVYVTDGDGPAPAHAPDFPTVWVLVDRASRIPADWGTVLRVGE